MNLYTILEMGTGPLGDREILTAPNLRQRYEDLDMLARRWEEYLRRSRTVGVAAMAENHPAVVGLLFGAGLAGVPFTPINPRFKREELLHAVDLVGADRLLAWGVRSNVPEAVAIDRPAVQLTRCGGVDPPNLGGPPGDGPADPVARIQVLTSGTTTKPKAVLLDHSKILQYLFASYEALSAAQGEASLVSAPLFHVAGLMNVLSSLFLGRRVVLLPRFDARSWLETAHDEKVTHAFLVPSMLTQVVQELTRQPDLYPGSLRSISYGGAPSSADQILAAARMFQDVDLVGAFGLSETSSTVCILGPDEHRAATRDEAGRRLLASVGKSIPGVEVAVVDDSGAAVGTGVEGEVVVRGPQVSGHYLGAPSRVDDAGWFHTGDLGHLDDGGYLFLSGRVDDMIQRGGENVSPREVELVFEAIDGVDDVAAFAIPDPEWGEVVCLAVVSPQGSSIEQRLRQVAELRLAAYKRPEQYVFLEELPRTVTGKVLRLALKSMLSGGLSQETMTRPRE
jgi:acyl-CoA synthetase (AMP-forming)/AMP-acid ligase II